MTVNGGAAILFSFGCRDGVLAGFSTGWVEGDQAFVETATSGSNPTLVFAYENYIIAGASTGDDDEVAVRLEADDDYTLTLTDSLRVGSDITPGSSTELAITRSTTAVERDHTVVNVEVEIRSDRAPQATLRLDLASDIVSDGAQPLDVEIRNGVGQGTLEFTVEQPRPSVLRGRIVAQTEGFNAPSAEFSLHLDASRSRSAQIYGIGIVFALLGAALLLPRGLDPRVPMTLVSIGMIVTLPVVMAWTADDRHALADSGGALWVTGLYAAIGIWVLAAFSAPMLRHWRHPTLRRGTVLVVTVAIGVSVALFLSDSPRLPLTLGLLPALGVATWWIQRPPDAATAPALKADDEHTVTAR